MVKRAFKYRFYPSHEQAAELDPDVRVRPTGLQPGVAGPYRGVDVAPGAGELQRDQRDADGVEEDRGAGVPQRGLFRAVAAGAAAPAGRIRRFWAKRARYPTFKSKKKSRRSAEYTTSAFRYRDGRLTLAKMAEPLDIVWSRPLPDGASPSTVTVSRDAAGPLVRVPALRRRDRAAAAGFGVRSGSTPGSTACSPCPPGRRSPTRVTSGPTVGGWPAPSGSWPANRRTRPTGPRPGSRSPGGTPGSPTGGGTTCTN